MKLHSIALFLPALAIPVAAWGVAGHQITATIAQALLTDRTRDALCHILPASAKCHLAPFAAWADTIKRNPTYRGWSAQMHYINPNGDWPSTHCEFGTDGWHDPERNIANAINNYTMLVQESTGESQDIALRFLIHYLGDLHQPLHLTGRERGANGIKVRFEKRISTLHGVWDGGLVTKAIREIHNYSHPLPDERIESALRGAIYDPYIRWIIKEGLLGWWKDEYLDWARCPGVPSATRVVGEYPSTRQALIYNAKTAASPQDDPSLPACPLHWSAPIHQLNCDVVFPPELDRPDPSGRHVLTTLAQSLFGWFGLESLAEPPLLELDTPAYAGKIREHKVVEKLLAMGGVRLAAILNDMFDSE